MHTLHLYKFKILYYVQQSTSRTDADRLDYLSLLVRKSVVRGSCWIVWCNIRASRPARLVMAVLTFRSCSNSSSNLYHCGQRKWFLIHTDSLMTCQSKIK